MDEENRELAWLPDLIYTGGRFQSGLMIVSDGAGRIKRIAEANESERSAVRLKGRAALPGLVNAHSHAFQRVIRGRTEYRTGKGSDDFWTWREMMYSAATRLSPEDLYDASRMTFLEMAASGITTVGEFHYIHHAPEGVPYDDPNLLSKTVIRAARDVGVKICLLRVAYARSGFRVEVNPKQARFMERDAESFLKHVEMLRAWTEKEDAGRAWVGLAPHSVRAVPLDYLHDCFRYAQAGELAVHMHVAEQPAELEACVREHGLTPVALLEREGFLSHRFTGVHGIHITEEEARMLSRSRSIICACPTTERNLGDGAVPSELLFREGVRVSLGTDSHTQIDMLEDARELEYNMRLMRLERVVLDRTSDAPSALASSLFDCATRHGAASIKIPDSDGTLSAGQSADFFTVDLHHPSIAGASEDDLLAHVVFSLPTGAVRDVVVGGRVIVEDGRHRAQGEIIEKFVALQKRLWS
ncbi:MAG TPA: formimidoylglutamate deiminase [Pyrinomonadaceae bacterium]|nr:formimidoylglutamate deiminase [Pyrinomonadaceae bacterium]